MRDGFREGETNQVWDFFSSSSFSSQNVWIGISTCDAEMWTFDVRIDLAHMRRAGALSPISRTQLVKSSRLFDDLGHLAYLIFLDLFLDPSAPFCFPRLK